MIAVGLLTFVLLCVAPLLVPIPRAWNPLFPVLWYGVLAALCMTVVYFWH